MDEARNFSITLSPDMALMVEAKVLSGEYPCANDVVSEGLTMLRDRDAGVEHWLRTEVA